MIRRDPQDESEGNPGERPERRSGQGSDSAPVATRMADDSATASVQPWREYLTERDLVMTSKEFDIGPPGQLLPSDVGTRPVVLAIDLQKHLFGDDVPILEAIEGYRTAMGEHAYRALEDLQPLLASARKFGIPVIYTRVIPGPASGLGPADTHIVDELAPADDETVIDKTYSSAFYGTDLTARLIRQGIDTVVLVGCSTGGCVRATAVDAWQHGFDVVIPAACTFDRVQAVRALTLLDIEAGYGRVVTRGAVERYFEDLERDGTSEDEAETTVRDSTQ